MTPITRLAGLAVAFATLAPAAATAQPAAGQITFYSQIGFRGQAYTATGPRENISIPWTVRSARVRGVWEVCTRNAYRGDCSRMSEDVGNVGLRVASARPARAAPSPPPAPQPGVGGSLRGMSAEFFPAPEERGRRVESCASGVAACTADAAARFCRARGWAAASYQRQQTVAGRNYLADVLCTRTR